MDVLPSKHQEFPIVWYGSEKLFHVFNETASHTEIVFEYQEGLVSSMESELDAVDVALAAAVCSTALLPAERCWYDTTINGLNYDGFLEGPTFRRHLCLDGGEAVGTAFEVNQVDGIKEVIHSVVSHTYRVGAHLLVATVWMLLLPAPTRLGTVGPTRDRC